MPAKPYPHVGVGWGDYVVAWLLTYSRGDCRLWSYVYSKCVEAGLCRELVEMLMNELRKHRCFALLNIDDVLYLKADQTPQPPNQPKHPNHPNPQNCPSKHLLKHSKTMPPRRLRPEPLPEAPQTQPPLSHTHPPLINAFPRVVGALTLSQAPPSGGPHRPDHWVQQEIQMGRGCGGRGRV